MVVWATNLNPAKSQPTMLHTLPLEIQSRVLYKYSTISSPVVSAKLGCELGLGSPFLWFDRDMKIGVQTNKTHRGETSPIESQIFFSGIMSGLSYKGDPRLG